MNKIRDAAVDMARRGYRVFPLKPGTKLPFEHDKVTPQEKPLAGCWHIATRDEAKINSWFDINPHINYGVSGAGLVILDVDVKKGKNGVEELIGLEGVTPTFMVTTTSGGLHLYYAGAEVSQRPPTKSIDIRSKGGYVVGPGSVIDGSAYVISEDRPAATISEELFERLKRGADPHEKSSVPLTDLDIPGAVAMAIAYTKKEPPAADGGRNNAAFPLACILKDFGISAERIFDILSEHWNARNDPPMSDADLTGCCQRAYTSGRYAPGIRNAAEEFKDVADGLQEIGATDWTTDTSAMDLRSSEIEKEKSAFGLMIQDRPAVDIPRRPWLVPGLLLKNSLSAIVAQPGARKSTFTVGLAVGFALGTLDHLGFELLGDATDVMLINNEDDEDEIDRRIVATCQVNGLDYEVAKSRIHLHKPEDGTPFIAMTRGNQGKLQAVTRFLSLRHYLQENKIGLVIFDPLADMHHGNENDNSEMAQVMSTLRSLARGQKIAGLVVHHSRKPDAASSKDYAGDPFSARGASAIHGNVRVLATLCSASENDGYQYLGVSPPYHLNYSRLDIGKGSYSPPGRHTRWYYCESCEIGPPDCGDTAPALKIVERSTQVERQIIAIHAAICEHRDLFDKQGEIPASEAAEFICGAMPETDHDTAMAFLNALFRQPRTVDGVTLELIGAPKKAVIRAR